MWTLQQASIIASCIALAASVAIDTGLSDSLGIRGHPQPIVSPDDHRSEDYLISPAPVGGPHGNPFDDWHWASGATHKRISNIQLFGCGQGEYLTAIKLGYRDNHAWNPATADGDYVQHGTYHGNAAPANLDFSTTAHIMSIEITTHKKLGHTRIGWIKISSNEADSEHADGVIECGIKQGTVTKWDTEKNGLLLYFSGRQGNALDLLQGHFTTHPEHY